MGAFGTDNAKKPPAQLVAFYRQKKNRFWKIKTGLLERITRLELATSTLARWRSTRWAKSAHSFQRTVRKNLVPPDGIEPSTRGFSVLCSTDWATEADCCLFFKDNDWRPISDSNWRPLAWQASVLTNWTNGPFHCRSCLSVFPQATNIIIHDHSTVVNTFFNFFCWTVKYVKIPPSSVII